MKYISTAIFAVGTIYTASYWLMDGPTFNREVGQSLLLVAGVFHLIWGDKKLF